MCNSLSVVVKETVGSLTSDQTKSGQPEDSKRKDMSLALAPRFKDSSWGKRLAFLIVFIRVQTQLNSHEGQFKVGKQVWSGSTSFPIKP
jgi:hypothetical protein